MRMMVEEENSIVFHDGEYGVPVRDGGSSYLVIEYCPWCGRIVRGKSAKNAKSSHI